MQTATFLLTSHTFGAASTPFGSTISPLLDVLSIPKSDSSDRIPGTKLCGVFKFQHKDAELVPSVRSAGTKRACSRVEFRSMGAGACALAVSNRAQQPLTLDPEP
eukprot:3582007-Rhodomonas_salina.1